MPRAWMSFLWSFGSLSKDAWLFLTCLAHLNTISPGLAVKGYIALWVNKIYQH